MSIKQKWLTLILLAALLLALTACQPIQPLPAVAPGATVSEAAPPTRTELAAPDTVSEILWDKWGVPHIFAQEPAGAFYGLG